MDFPWSESVGSGICFFQGFWQADRAFFAMRNISLWLLRRKNICWLTLHK